MLHVGASAETVGEELGLMSDEGERISPCGVADKSPEYSNRMVIPDPDSRGGGQRDAC